MIGCQGSVDEALCKVKLQSIGQSELWPSSVCSIVWHAKCEIHLLECVSWVSQINKSSHFLRSSKVIVNVVESKVLKGKCLWEQSRESQGPAVNSTSLKWQRKVKKVAVQASYGG